MGDTNKQASKAKKAPKEEEIPFIDWKNSKAKEIILYDLMNDVLPLDADEVSPREAWDLVYKHLVAFASPPVPYRQFVARLRDHRNQVIKMKERSLGELEILRSERLLFPRATHNSRGEPVFDLSPAKALLKDDVEKKRHKGMTPSEFQKTRPEYAPFSAKKFRHRIYQAERREKFVNCMEMKRKEKEAQMRQEHQSDLYR